MLLDRKSSRSSALPRFKPSTTTTTPIINPTSSPPPPPISSLSAIKNWFDGSTIPPPPVSTQPPTTTTTTTTTEHEQPLKPLRNSLRKRTPSNLFNRRLSNTIKSKPIITPTPQSPLDNKNTQLIPPSNTLPLTKDQTIKLTNHSLSLGIQYNQPPTSIITSSDPIPSPLFKPNPRSSSLHPLSTSTIHPTDQLTLPRLISRQSTMTLASTCSEDEDQFKSSDLASIQLPSTPTTHHPFRPSARSNDLISDFPLPPSRETFLSSSFGLTTISHPEPMNDLTGLPHHSYSPSLPPQIPLPPLPPSRPNLLQTWSPLPFSGNTPTPTSSQAMDTNPFESPEISGLSYNLDDLLDLYDTHDSPVSHQRSKPIHPSQFIDLEPPLLDLKLSIESLTTHNNPNLLDVDLPSRTTSPDNLIPSSNNNQQDQQSLDNIRPSLEFGSDNEGETSSEIDLNEPLDMMAVRLGYQVDLPDGSDSGDESSDLRRNQEFDDEDQLLDNGPHPSRGPSRQAVLQMRSHSSLRGNMTSSRCRMNRVVIAEASSSDEEEFDLKLDHQHLSKYNRAHEGSELMGEQEPKWNASSRSEWKRLSIGSTGTLGSFTTTPSSSHSSYQTNFSTPNSTQVLTFPDLKANKTLVGLGFEGVLSGEPPALQPEAREHHQLPGKPGSYERREWLQRAFCKRDLVGPAQERSISMPGPSKSPLQLEEEPVSHDEKAHDDSCHGSGEEKTRSDHITVQIDHSTTGHQRNSRRLKPLMLVSRKDRHLSYPLINSTIAEEDPSTGPRDPHPSSIPTHLASSSSPRATRNSYSSSSSSLSNPTRVPRARTSLVNLSYHRSSSSTHHPLHLISRPSPL